MIRNILPCLCVAMIRNFGIASIREALETFVPGPLYTPGRMNLFSFGRFDVMVDYAHNPDGFREMMKFLRKTEASRNLTQTNYAISARMVARQLLYLCSIRSPFDAP